MRLSAAVAASCALVTCRGTLRCSRSSSGAAGLHAGGRLCTWMQSRMMASVMTDSCAGWSRSSSTAPGMLREIVVSDSHDLSLPIQSNSPPRQNAKAKRCTAFEA